MPLLSKYERKKREGRFLFLKEIILQHLTKLQNRKKKMVDESMMNVSLACLKLYTLYIFLFRFLRFNFIYILIRLSGKRANPTSHLQLNFKKE